MGNRFNSENLDFYRAVEEYRMLAMGTMPAAGSEDKTRPVRSLHVLRLLREMLANPCPA